MAIGTTWAALLSSILKFELSAAVSRIVGQIKSGENLAIGTILGATLRTGATATGAAGSGNTGDGTIGTVTAGSAGRIGVYRATCIRIATNAGDFLVTDPWGVPIGVAVVGSAFADQVGFTIADGATDFAVGDYFEITVAGDYEYEGLDLSATNGADVAAGVLLEAVDASAAAKNGGVLVRGPATLADAGLVYPAGATAAQKRVINDRLTELGMVVAEAA